jgi:broad specificity phosphatase PhoE
VRRLILVRHSEVAVEADVPAASWRLSPVGRSKCDRLATMLAEYGPTAIVASTEPKATETADVVARRLGLTVEAMAGLREHDRAGVPFWNDRAEFESRVAEMFERPAELVLGQETAADAQRRFSFAIEEALGRHRHGNLVVVAHGTVITLFVARHNDMDAYEYWRSLGMPSFAVLSVPDMVLLETVADVGHEPPDRVD